MLIKSSKSVPISASADVVWKINGEGFANIGKWTRHVLESGPISGGPVGDSEISGRTCEVKGFGHVTETLTEFNAEQRKLTLLVDSGLPFFVKHTLFTSQIVPVSENECRFELDYRMEVQCFWGTLLLPFLRLNLAKAIDTIISDLKFYAERGEVHPEKVKALRAA